MSDDDNGHEAPELNARNLLKQLQLLLGSKKDALTVLRRIRRELKKLPKETPMTQDEFLTITDRVLFDFVRERSVSP